MSNENIHQRVKIFFDNKEREEIHFVIAGKEIIEIIDSGNGLPYSSEDFHRVINELKSNKHSQRITKVSSTGECLGKDELAALLQCSPEIIHLDLI